MGLIADDPKPLILHAPNPVVCYRPRPVIGPCSGDKPGRSHARACHNCPDREYRQSESSQEPNAQASQLHTAFTFLYAASSEEEGPILFTHYSSLYLCSSRFLYCVFPLVTIETGSWPAGYGEPANGVSIPNF